MVQNEEKENFLNLIENLEKLDQTQIKQLNISCNENKINLDKNKIKGVF